MIVTRTYQIVCRSCNGSGSMHNFTFNANITGDRMIIACIACSGTGLITVTETFTEKMEEQK